MKEAGGANHFFNGFKGRCGKISRRFKTFKKHRSNLIHLFVGALSRKNSGNQKLKRVLMKQLGFDFRINLSQNFTNFIQVVAGDGDVTVKQQLGSEPLEPQTLNPLIIPTPHTSRRCDLHL